MKAEYVYLCVTKDRYELPVAVADSAAELAQITGVDKSTVTHSVLASERTGRRSRYIRVRAESGVGV